MQAMRAYSMKGTEGHDVVVKHPMATSQGLLQSSHVGIAVGHFLPRSVFVDGSDARCYGPHCDPCPTHIHSEDRNASVLLNPWAQHTHILSMPGRFHGEQL